MPRNEIAGYDIDFIKLKSASGEVSDITLLSWEFNIYESLFSSTISGNIILVDATDRIGNLPIKSVDEIEIRFKSEDFISSDYISYTGNIVKISNKDGTSQGLQIYQLNFIDIDQISNSTKKISKSYSGNYNDICQSVFSELESDNQLVIGSVDTSIRNKFIIPYWSPLYAIHWISPRIISPSGVPDFFFWQSLGDGENRDYQIKSISSLIDNEANDSIIGSTVYPYTVMPGNYNLESTANTIYERKRMVESISVLDYMDTITNINNGMYSGRMVIHDIFNKHINNDISMGYGDLFEKGSHLARNPFPSNLPGVGDLSSFDDSFVNFYPAHTKLYDDFYNNDESSNRYSEKYALARNSIIRQIDNIKLQILVSGDSNRRVGDVVHFNLPAYESVDFSSRLNRYDKLINDRFLVTSVRHSVVSPNGENEGSYKMIMELMKDGFVA